MLQTFNEKNANILVGINEQLRPRAEASVSVFDSVVQGGDAVWEGLRVYDGRIFCLDEHLDRLLHSAHILGFEGVPARETIEQAIFNTLRANGMYDGVHIRLTLTRGEKITSGMDPRLNQQGCTLIVLAEWKAPVYPPGITLVTASQRRNSPAFLDSKIHHNNLLNNILAKMEANFAGADDALMLDDRGFVAETNATNIFCIRNGVVETPLPHACLPGITRGLVLDICRQQGIPCAERNLSLAEFYVAEEVFVSGTMGELTRVESIDGRSIRCTREPLLPQLQGLFRERTRREGRNIPR